jgi:HD-GYP domain-containing protein (c-di-GMP phosphodiesterase class II)
MRKAIQLYPPAHPAYREAVDGFVRAAADALAEGPVVINLHEGRLYTGSDVITEDGPGMSSLADAMEARLVESLTLEAPFEEKDAEGLAAVLNLRPSAELDVEEELAKRGVRHVHVGTITDAEAEEREERDRRRQEDRALYQRLVGQLRRLSEMLKRGEDVELSTAAPMVEQIMKRLMEDEAAVLGMATINAGSEEELLHGINVMIYSLHIGVALGLPEEGLTSLGISALTHDIGKVAFERDDPAQMMEMERLHPTIGADMLSRVPDETHAPMLVAYEHHMGTDGSGFPERTQDYVAHPYSRMVSVANRYDRLSKAGENGEPTTPDKAVAALLRRAGGELDPFFTRLFVRVLGVFPIGCVVRLSDHSVGIVYSRGEDLFAPKVRIVLGVDGLELEEPVDVDMAGDDRSVVEVVAPEDLGVTVSEYL